MESTKKSLSVFKLIIQALKNANQVFGSGLALTIVFIIWSVFIYILFKLVSFVFPLNGGIFVFLIPIAILSVWIQSTYNLGLLQIVASNLEKSGKTMVDVIAGSCLPAVYLLVDTIIFMIPFVFFTKMIHSWLTTSGGMLAYTVVMGLIILPFLFTPAILALREEGPIESLQYSYQLFKSHVKPILLILFKFFLISLTLNAIFYIGLKFLIPVAISSPTQFFLVKILGLLHGNVLLFKVLVFASVGIFTLYMSLVTHSIYVLFFFYIDSLDQIDSQFSNSLENEISKEITFSPDGNPDVQIKQSSVSTQSDEHTERHLNQVYDAQQHLQQALHQEEDRIPTLFLDEEMAQQLKENERKMQQQQELSAKRQDEADNQDPIQISDKPL